MEALPFTDLSELAHTFVRLVQTGLSAEDIDKKTDGHFSDCQEVWSMSLPLDCVESEFLEFTQQLAIDLEEQR
jgi:hypothetical protein